MKKLLLILLVIFILSIPVFATDVNKYPSEQMIKRCFPVGCSWWKAKLNVAQLMLDYNIATINFDPFPQIAIYPNINILIYPAINKELDITLQFKEGKLIGYNYVKVFIHKDGTLQMPGNW
jgi:hypothetical protein